MQPSIIVSLGESALEFHRQQALQGFQVLVSGYDAQGAIARCFVKTADAAVWRGGSRISYLSSATGHSDQNSHTYRNCEGDQRTLFGLGSYLLQRITTNLGTDFDGLVAKTGRLIDGDALATTKPIYYSLKIGTIASTI